MPLVTPRIGCEATTGTAFDGKPYRERITGAGDSVGVLPVFDCSPWGRKMQRGAPWANTDARRVFSVEFKRARSSES
jgi:hypothetical protein